MKMRGALLVSLLFFGLGKATAQYVQVDEIYTPQQLVTDILIDNPCANASNVAASGWIQSSGGSIGHFTYSGTDFPFSEGIILSTGRATSATGPNSSLLSEGPTSWGGDADLEAALSVSNSINATVLEFDFLPFASEIRFDYVFSSEQYLSNPSANQCNYTDGFVFLLREAGSTAPYQNLAVIPGTTTPVKVNTVRGPGTTCPPANAEWFDAFNGSNHPTNYNGQTKQMQAVATVTPGVLYHMKLVVADQGNNLYDSAIFLGAGSFQIGKSLGTDRLRATGNPVCFGETLTVDATQPGATAYQWYRDTNLLAGETNPTLDVTLEGDYRVEITFGTGCVSPAEMRIEFASQLTPANASLSQCDLNGDGVATFDITLADATVRNGDADIVSVTYFALPGDANPIADPTRYPSANATVTAVSADAYGCRTSTQVILNVVTASAGSPVPQATCDTDQDGIAPFDLDAITASLTGLPPGATVTYFASIAEAEATQNQLPSSFSNTTPFSQTIFAKVVGGGGCNGIIPVPLTVRVFDTTGLQDEPVFICNGIPETLTAPSGYAMYAWDTTPPSTIRTIRVSAAGTYTVTLTDANGCSGTKRFIVTASDAATIDAIEMVDFRGGKNSVTISASGPGDYEYSIDGGIYQASPIFTDVPGGAYLAHVRDRNGCGLSTQPFHVLDYPKYFTPNGDSYNDIWHIPFLPFMDGSLISVFDRYGKLLAVLGKGQPGWDGTLGGQPLPADDYWFSIDWPDGRNIRGHFALKR